MRVASAAGHQPRHRTTGHRSRRLHQHLQIVAVGESPLHLARGIGRKRPQQFWLDGGGSGGHGLAPLRNRDRFRFCRRMTIGSVMWIMGACDRSTCGEKWREKSGTGNSS